MDIEQIIAKRYKELPNDVQQAIKNTDLASIFNKISEKHGLLIDQNGNLQTETILVMLGLESSDDFVDNIQKALEISRDKALEITNDVNIEILNSIKDSLRKLQTEQEAGGEEVKEVSTPRYTDVHPISIPIPTPSAPIKPLPKSVEEAGEFTLEKPVAPQAPSQYNETNLNREDILKSIEDVNIPLVDHLLTTPVTNSSKPQEKVVEKVVESAPVIPKPPEVKRDFSNTPKTDPYREQI